MAAVLALLTCVNADAQEPASFESGGAPAGALVDESAGPSAGEIRRMFGAAARLYGLDPELLAAIAQVESDGDAGAVSPMGAQGLMQLMPATARRFGVARPFDPSESMLGGARFLSHLKRRQASRPELALNLPELIAAYNAGEGAVEKYGGIPPYAETRQYVRKVLLTYLMERPGPEPAPALAIAFDSHPGASRDVALEPAPDAYDALDQLGEIRRQRTLALSRPQPSPSR